MKFFEYFGVVGTLSVLAWIGVGVALIYSRREFYRSWRWLFAALAAALMAWGLSEWNSANVMLITLDEREASKRTIEENAKLAAASGEAPKPTSIGADFAEDTKEDKLIGKEPDPPPESESAEPASKEPRSKKSDMRAAEAKVAEGKKAAALEAEAAKKTTEVDSTTAAQPESTELVSAVDSSSKDDPANSVAEFKKDGKKVRSADKKVEGSEKVSIAIADTRVRYMKGPDFIAAKMMDRMNRYFVTVWLWACLAMMAWDYLRAFNATVNVRWLAPIGGRWLDDFSPKVRLVRLTPGGAGMPAPEAYAKAVLHRGGNLIYFGTQDPWPEERRLARVSYKSRVFWGQPKLVAGRPDIPPSVEFLLDAAWFSRYAVVISLAAEARAILGEMVELLEKRHDSGASSGHTLHIVWALPEPPSRETVAAMERLVADTDVCLAVWTNDEGRDDLPLAVVEPTGPIGKA